MSQWESIFAAIEAATGEPFQIRSPCYVGSGCINRAAVLNDGRRRFFVKLNRAHRLPMFEAEAAGLAEMAATRSIRVPKPLGTGLAGTEAFLLLEYVALDGRRTTAGEAQAGRQLAALHRTTRKRFGWDRDNTIGSTPQPNALTENWIEFWRKHRLGFQLELAAQQGYRGQLQARGQRLLETFDPLLSHDPVPSLLHGDLWGGNLDYTTDGAPVLYDPAVYFGDREADLAMTELFGGFGSHFYAAYDEAWSLDPGYRVRKDFYNLYHVLNHLNLFGSGYLGQAQRLIDRLLAQLG